MGNYTTASGGFSTAMSSGTEATGDYSTAMGNSTKARSYGETAIGLYNTDYTPGSTTNSNSNDRLFVAGNGTSSTFRSNAFAVLKNGNVNFSGVITDDGSGLTNLPLVSGMDGSPGADGATGATGPTGVTASISGILYTVTDSSLLKTKITNQEDITNLCVSKITNMRELFSSKYSFN